MNTSTLSQKGWVVIPRELRKRYGLKKGDVVQVIDYGGVISIIPGSKTPIKDAKGMLKGKTSLVKELMNSRRHDAGHGK
jgi:AbrB family looped-hinge helix DNA binding protein